LLALRAVHTWTSSQTQSSNEAHPGFAISLMIRPFESNFMKYEFRNRPEKKKDRLLPSVVQSKRKHGELEGTVKHMRKDHQHK
jgi:hypothetical protein